MKNIKRILIFALSFTVLTAALAGCGEKDRILYAKANLSKLVELGEYKGIEVDTSSAEYQKFYANEISNDVADNELYVKATEGKVEDGSIVNIDYEGKKDGVAFEGGTAQGYDLTIGSNSFIDGFEEGLIGKEIGTTVELPLTFPANYHSADLAGKAVVFTVKINSAKLPKAPEDSYKEMGFNLLKEYENDLKKRAIESYLLNKLIDDSKVNKYPQEDIDILKEGTMKMTEASMQAQGLTMDYYLSYIGQTKEQFEEELVENEVKPTMDTQMPVYALLDAENEQVTQKEIDSRMKELIKDAGDNTLKKEDLLEYFGEYYFENLVATEKAVEIMYKNAKIS